VDARLAVKWLVPDLALVAATVTLFYCLFLFQGYQKLFRDSDAGWHIRTGESILITSQLPRTDPYSFSRAGQPWFAWEWGADVLMGAVHRAAGLRAVAWMYGVAIAAGVWLWFRLTWAVGGDFLLACVMAPLALSSSNIHWLARPHVLGWLFLMAALLWAETAGRRFGWRRALVIAVFMAAWANIHASFFLALIVAALYALGRLISWWVVPVCAIAPLANPYGWHLYAHVFRYLTDTELLSRIGEFQSFNFHTEGSWQIMAAVMLGIAGGAMALAQGRVERFGLAVVISAMALRSARGLPLVGLVLLPMGLASLAGAGRGTRWVCGSGPGAGGLAPLAWGRGFADRFATYTARLRAIDARFRGWALVPLVAVAAFLLLRFVPVGFPPDQFPVEAYRHIPAGARLFAPDKYGGYLIYRSSGTLKVFFDNRSDFYGADFLTRYGRMVQLRPN
jgi:hypothetical protein